MNPFGLFPRLSNPYLVLPLKPGRRRPGCAPAAHTTRSRPRAAAAAAAAEIKEKETKHYGKRSSPFKAPKTRQAHASPPRPHYGVGGRGAKGEGSSFSVPCATPHSAPPQVLQEPKGQQWRRKGDAFPRAPRCPSTARWYFAFLKFCPLRALPPSHSILPDHSCPHVGRPLFPSLPPGQPRAGPELGPRPPLAGGVRGDPALATPLRVPLRVAPGAARHRSAPVPRSPRKRSEEKHSGNSSGSREHASSEAPMSGTARGH